MLRSGGWVEGGVEDFFVQGGNVHTGCGERGAMASVFDFIASLFGWSKASAKIVFVGLDFSGKTSILKRFSGQDVCGAGVAWEAWEAWEGAEATRVEKRTCRAARMGRWVG
jgi:ADP-ribosylation factor family